MKMRAINLKMLSGVLALVCLMAFPPLITDARAVAMDSVLLAQIDEKQAAKIVAKKTGGTVLSVVARERKGVAGYQVKVLLPEGRIRKVFVNKQSGAVAG